MGHRLLATCGALMVAACGPSPVELCRRTIALHCDRTFECTPTETLEQLKATVGGSAAECKTLAEETQGCAAKWTEYDLCADGKTYHLDKASTCSDKVKAQSCADFLDPLQTPAECGLICT